MIKALPPVRRIVTGVDSDGRSYIVEDGPSSATLTLPQRPGYRNANLWRTSGSNQPVDAPDDIGAHRGVCPPPGGTVLRVIDIPPQPADPAERRLQSAATFSAMFPDASHHDQGDKPPGMHETPTVDYAIVLQGELVAVLDKEETVMRAGDVLVQRGTSHAWANRSADMARIAFILVDAQPSSPGSPRSS